MTGSSIPRLHPKWYEGTMPSREIRRVATLPAGTTRLAAVADTHSQMHPATLGALANFGPDAILHAGDIGDLSVLDELARIAPVFAIRGNIDSTASDLPDQLVLNHGQLSLRIAMVHIGVYGPNLRRDVEAWARKEQAHLVVCGHSHVPFIGAQRGITVFNPGSCGPRRFALPIVLGTLELSTTGLKLAHIDCETGNAWLPP